MVKYKEYMGLKVMPGSKLYQALEDRDTKKAKRLVEYMNAAAACYYDAKVIAELRQKYSDIM